MCTRIIYIALKLSELFINISVVRFFETRCRLLLQQILNEAGICLGCDPWQDWSPVVCDSSPLLIDGGCVAQVSSALHRPSHLLWLRIRSIDAGPRKTHGLSVMCLIKTTTSDYSSLGNVHLVLWWWCLLFWYTLDWTVANYRRF